MAITKVLVAVKTYPLISTKYDEIVCTAGFREDGSWIRIYPIPFRSKPYTEQYKKYDWIELDLVKNEKDFRPESYRPYSIDGKIEVVGHIDTNNNWHHRKAIVLGNVYTNLTQLIREAKDKNIGTSLAVFKPGKICDFVVESVEKEWDKAKLERLNQLNLFDTEQAGGKLKVVKKLPYKFKYVWEDDQGVKSSMMIEDWEVGQLFWNCLSKYDRDETKALDDVKKKYLFEFARTKDLYLFLGTTQAHHYISHNPFMIIGTFHPKKEEQQSLF